MLFDLETEVIPHLLILQLYTQEGTYDICFILNPTLDAGIQLDIIIILNILNLSRIFNQMMIVYV